MSRRKTKDDQRARARARRILAIHPGTLSLYAAYLVVCFRLLIIAVQGTQLPGLA